MLKIFRKIDPRLSAELKKQKRPIFLGLVCATVTSLLTAATIPMVNFAVHAITVKDLDQLLNVCVGVVGLFTVKYFFTRGQVYFLSYAANRLASDMRLRLFEKLQRLPISYFNAKRAGAIQSVLSNDVNVYQTAVTLIRDSIDGPLKATAAFVSVFILQWQLGLVALLSIPILAWLVQQNSKRVRRAQSQVQKDLSELTAMSQESLQGTRVIRAFSAEDQMRDEYGTLIEQSMKSQMTAVRRIATLRPMVEWLGAVTLAAILYLCGIMAKAGTLTVADIAALLVALDVINQGQRNIASVSNTYSQVQAAADRIYGEVLDYPEQHAEEAGKRTLPEPCGKIEFHNVGFTYPDGTRALEKVSFAIEPGTSLALVGSSGAGKSTIADLLLRFYDPTAGEILFDNQNVKSLQAAWLRNQIGVVPQQTFLFAGTIAENIRLGSPDATDDEIREAARTAHANVFIDEMPEGYDTYLGERGIRLSGGEMQRIAIARAVIRRPRVLLLDEATSNLDAVSEKAVQEALEEVMKGRTTLFIAHRLSTAARADKILVLSHGSVMEYGSHSELLAAKGPYSAMFDAFSKGVMDESVG